MKKNENQQDLVSAQESLEIVRDQLKQIEKQLKKEKKRQRKEKKQTYEPPQNEEDFRAYRSRRGTGEIRWRKLDNTALMYPIITGETVSNVYRISVTLKEEILPQLLQEALDRILPQFPLFNSRLRQGVFWYYLEENGQEAPQVRRENTYPCRYINAEANKNYLFRVTYFRRRINLEVFHVLTDGMGAINFLKELLYQYLRLAHRELAEFCGDKLSSRTSLSTEDSFSDNYQKKPLRPYHFRKAYILHGPQFPAGKVGILQANIPLDELKKAAKARNASINEYIVAALTWAIYLEKRHSMDFSLPIVTVVPVNLRPFFQSVTTNNFFANVNAIFTPRHMVHTFEDVLDEVRTSLRKQITKEHLEEQFSTNVSTATNLLSRAIPMLFKRPALKAAYNKSTRAATTTVSNLGAVHVRKEYQPYVDKFSAVISETKGQGMRNILISYENRLVLTITSVFRRPSIQEEFFRFLFSEGVPVLLESNGVYYS